MKKLLMLIVFVCACGNSNEDGEAYDYDCRQRSTDIEVCFRVSNNATLKAIIEKEPKPKKMLRLSINSVTDAKLLEHFNELEDLEVLEIYRTPALINFKWMPKLKRLGKVEIHDNPNFVNFEGWESLTKIKFVADQGPSWFHRNPKLRSFKGLENLVSAMDGLLIEECPNFETIEHLKSLEEVMGISLSGSNKIKVFKTLPNLKFTYGISGRFNSQLERIERFPKLEMISKGVQFENNPNFIDCTAENFANSTKGFTGQLRLINNKPDSRCVDVLDL